MARDTNTAMQEEKVKEANRPIELFLIFLDEQTLYFASPTAVPIEFFDENGNAQTYTPFLIKRTRIKRTSDMKIDHCTVSFGNVTREMSSYIAATDFRGRDLAIWKVFLDRLDSFDNKFVMFRGEMDRPETNKRVATVKVVSKLDALDRKLPGRVYQPSCNFTFGDNSCNHAVPALTGAVESFSDNNQTVNDTGITEFSGYWDHGSVTIGKETRIILDSGSGFVTVEYPFSGNVQAGDSYLIEAGCDKSYNAGHGCTFWSNTSRYGGFLRIPKLRDVRIVD